MFTQKNNTTLVDTTQVENLEVIVGDEKQEAFYPRAKLKAWGNEVNLSIGLADAEGGTHEVIGDKAIWTKGNTQAVFYTKDKRTWQPATTANYAQLGTISPQKVPTEYELSAKQKWETPTLVTYACQEPTLMFFSTYHADEYVDWDTVDIPMVRASSSMGNPYYMDAGLPMIDFHFIPEQFEGVDLDAAWHTALIDTLATYGITAYTLTGAGKVYVKDGDKDVKITSPQVDRGHLWTYININCEYTKYLDYYKAGLDEPPRDPHAYGLQPIFPGIDFSTLVDEVCISFLDNLGLAINEIDIVFESNPVHTTEEWVRYALRDDTDYFFKENHPHLEFEVILASQPASNVIPMTIETKDLEIIPQPPLTSTEALTSYRPPNIVGSVALYHESKQHNQYKTGKFVHIDRPIATDAAGSSVWCDFDVNNSLSIVVPQPFLDTAIYPVIIDPTFGYTTVGASPQLTGNIIVVCNFRGLQGRVEKLTSNQSAGASSALWKMAIYKFSGSLLIKQSSEITGFTGQATRDFTGMNNVAIGDDNFDLALWSSAPTPYEGTFFDAGSTNQGGTQSLTYTGTYPSPGTFVRNNNKYSFYATVIQGHEVNHSLMGV